MMSPTQLYTRPRVMATTALLAAAAAFAAYLWWPDDTGAAALAERPLIPVRTATVEQRAEVPMLHRAPADVRSLRSVDVRSQVDGVLDEVVAREGMTVGAGDVLARIDDRLIVSALAQARAQHAMAVAQLRVARLDLARYRSLRKEEAVSTQVLEQQAARVSELDASARNLEAAVQTQQVLLSHTEIRSPLNGRVGIQRLHAGNVLRTAEAQVLFTVVQMDPISVEISLPQSLLPRIREALAGTAPVPVQAYASDGGDLLAQGRLSLIDNQVSAASGTVRLKALFDNPQGRLWPGQSVVATVALQVMNDVLVVPAKAVQRGENGRFVWRVDDATTQPVPVQLRYATDEWAVVDGLAQDASVVVDGASRLYPGARVRAEAAEDASGQSRLAAAGAAKAGDDAAP
ncbi:efflux RND transporter periplasmic adaptor subunit [Achromobacter anxifer]|uniref:efflux RND transporter periplasmic adaptor subunit n=1 Tax=Achromobacter anxifer TaxID=1287737 RepID=UPI0023F742F2|nr:efflux RND transporter periplasmic adaptor subunit [Achromobacter anxifer]MDF8360659.1 efflux RND transporter periplasmic adaptor subunit [Achromobacter anxifer]